MVKGSDGQEYPDHIDYDWCPECGEPVDPANCWTDDMLGLTAWHPDCRREL